MLCRYRLRDQPQKIYALDQVAIGVGRSQILGPLGQQQARFNAQGVSNARLAASLAVQSLVR